MRKENEASAWVVLPLAVGLPWKKVPFIILVSLRVP